MINISGIENGYVIDHIEAGKSLVIFDMLQLSEYEGQVAIIRNAKSKKKGTKDMIKIEGLVDLDLEMLGFMDDNITVNTIENGNIKEKKSMVLPKKIKGIAKCMNPRCITSVEQGLVHEFILTDPEKKTYRCRYCEEKFEEKKQKWI